MKEMVYRKPSSTEILDQGEHKGFKYAILSLGTHPCAYVENKLHVQDCYDECLSGIKVHGGFTYVGMRLSRYGDYTDYLGWDYGHYSDYFYNTLGIYGKMWTTEEIQKEVFNVIDQLFERLELQKEEELE